MPSPSSEAASNTRHLKKSSPASLQAAQRIVVIGTTGSGKSTFAAGLARRLGLRLIDLDELAWRPGWVKTPVPRLRALVDQATRRPRWVVAGNWRCVRDLIWPRADLLVALDYDLPVVFGRLVARTWRRVRDGAAICNGNHESWWTQLATRDSLLLWCLRTFAKRRAEMRALAAPGGSEVPVLRLARPDQAEAWLVGLATDWGSAEGEGPDDLAPDGGCFLKEPAMPTNATPAPRDSQAPARLAPERGLAVDRIARA